MMIFRNWSRNGTEFLKKIPPDDILEGLYKLRIRESEKLKTVLELYNMEIHQKKAGPDNHRLKTMVKRSTEQNLRIKNFEARNGNYEGTPWSRIRGQNSVDKELLEIVGDGKPTGSVPKETIAVSVTIAISVQNRHSRILLRVLSCGRMRKELAPIHSVKSGILQNACSASPRVVVDLEKSADTHTVRLMNSLVKGPKRMMTEVQWAMLKKSEHHHIHDNWIAYSRIWSRRRLLRFYGRAQTYGNRSDV